MDLPQPGSALIFVIPDTIGGHIDARGLGFYLEPWWGDIRVPDAAGAHV